MPNHEENEKYLAELVDLEEKGGIEVGLQKIKGSGLTKQKEKDLVKDFVKTMNDAGFKEAEEKFRNQIKDMTVEDVKKNLPHIRAINFIIETQESLKKDKSGDDEELKNE